MSENHDEADKTPGIMSWQELVTPDVEASTKFYTDLMGYDVETMDMPNGAYHMFKAGDRYVGGLVQPPESPEGMPAHWINYITVEDLDATVAKAQELGAKLCFPPMDVPGKGRFATFTDPQGAAIAFWEFAADSDC